MTSTAFGPTETANVNGTTLAYREQGRGEPVVFVHGGSVDLRAWDQQLPEIGRSFRAITYSRRFARPNEPIDPEAGWSTLTQVEDLAALLRELDATPAHLVGNSGGALICLLTALRHPEVVRSLVLEEPPVMTLFAPRFPPRPADLLHLVATRPRTAIALFRFLVAASIPARKAFERGEDEEGHRIFARGVLGRKSLEEMPESFRQQVTENPGELRALLLRPDAEAPALQENDLQNLRIPVLLVTGELSPVFLLRLTDWIEELLPISERVEIPGASHIMHAEDPPAVNAAILDFLERHRDQPTSPPSL